jgi:hypothetical protein
MITPEDKTRLSAKLEKIRENKKIYDEEIRKILTYVAAGALGLFVTLNEKTIDLATAQNKNLLFWSVFFLILSFFSMMIINFLTSFYIGKRRDKIQNLIAGKSAETEASIEAYRKRNNKILSGLSYSILISLILGIILEINFVYFNVFNTVKPKEQNGNVLNIKITGDYNKITKQQDTIIINK